MLTECKQTLNSNSRLMSLAATLVALILILLFQCQIQARADDSAARPALDMGALASIASNLGSNPQLMSMVSSLFSQNGQKPPVGDASSSLSGSNEEDLQYISSDPEPEPEPSRATGGIEGLKRGPKKETTAPTGSTASQASTASGGTSLNSLMSLLPSFLPGLKLDGLSSLLGQQNKGVAAAAPAAAATTATTTTNTQQAAPSGASSPATASQGPPVPSNRAQTVINQVLSAYASGQIPNELIQLGLSGKIPPQLIEMGLSGQVPPQIIRMVVTGQVPMSTINSFLGTMGVSGTKSSSASSGGASSTASAASASAPSSITRTIFEALFRSGMARNKEGHSINVPTLLGTVPIQVPNVRRFGQMVGGTITNMASLIPF